MPTETGDPPVHFSFNYVKGSGHQLGAYGKNYESYVNYLKDTENITIDTPPGKFYTGSDNINYAEFELIKDSSGNYSTLYITPHTLEDIPEDKYEFSSKEGYFFKYGENIGSNITPYPKADGTGDSDDYFITANQDFDVAYITYVYKEKVASEPIKIGFNHIDVNTRTKIAELSGSEKFYFEDSNITNQNNEGCYYLSGNNNPSEQQTSYTIHNNKKTLNLKYPPLFLSKDASNPLSVGNKWYIFTGNVTVNSGDKQNFNGESDVVSISIRDDAGNRTNEKFIINLYYEEIEGVLLLVDHLLWDTSTDTEGLGPYNNLDEKESYSASLKDSCSGNIVNTDYNSQIQIFYNPRIAKAGKEYNEFYVSSLELSESRSLMLCSAQAYDIDGGIQNIQLGNFIKYNSDGSEIAEGDEEREANYYKIKVEGSAFQGKNLIDENYNGYNLLVVTYWYLKGDAENNPYYLRISQVYMDALNGEIHFDDPKKFTLNNTMSTDEGYNANAYNYRIYATNMGSVQVDATDIIKNSKKYSFSYCIVNTFKADAKDNYDENEKYKKNYNGIHNKGSKGVFITNTEININDLDFTDGYEAYITLVYTPLGSNSIVNLIGWLDFVNTSYEFKSSTVIGDEGKKSDAYTKYNTQWTGSTNCMDKIPSTESLSPYVAGAYPYVVSGIKYGTKTEDFSDSVTVTPYVWEIVGYTEGEDPKPIYGYVAKDPYEYKCTVTLTNYRIKSFSYYKIKNGNYKDSSENIGGTQIFADNKSSDINVSQEYKNRVEYKFNENKIVNVTCKKTDVYYKAASPTKEKVASDAGVEYNICVTNDYITLGSINLFNDNEINKIEEKDSFSEDISLDIDLTKKDSSEIIYASYLSDTAIPKNALTTYTDFDYDTNKRDLYSSSKKNLVNGMRQLYCGSMNYEKEVYEENEDVSVDGENTKMLNKGKWEDNTTSTYTDLFDKNKNRTISMNFYNDNEWSSVKNEPNVGKIRPIDVFTPITIDAKDNTIISDSGNYNNIINHDKNNNANYNLILQSGTRFAVEPKYGNADTYNNLNTGKYSKGYFLKFDFDVNFDSLSGGGSPYSYSTKNFLERNTTIKSGDVIYVEGASTIFYGYPSGYGLAEDANINFLTEHKIQLVCITNNCTDSLKNEIAKKLSGNNDYSSKTYYANNLTALEGRTDGSSDQIKIFKNNNGELRNLAEDITYSSLHAAIHTFKTTSINRIFGFTVTDCTDIAWKDIFRKNDTSDSTVNKTTGKQYYSGINQWDLSLINLGFAFNDGLRSQLEDKVYTLPLGPYKNKKVDGNQTYIYAPKLGYRISYNVKTTGSLASNNEEYQASKIHITPHYYYVSKDGKTEILPNKNETEELTDNIKLYYKNSSGKYVEFQGSNYSMYYKPKDGYRYLNESTDSDSGFANYSWSSADDVSMLSNKLIQLKISDFGGFYINSNSSTSNNNNYIHAWFGEFKLPNSTIAVDTRGTENSGYNTPNNPLKDGYIGVIFDIEYIIDGKCISYNINNKAVEENNKNTSQWDYEGYMQISRPGFEYSTTLQLEKGTWKISASDYNKIKGTVILYDTDARAANDFN